MPDSFGWWCFGLWCGITLSTILGNDGWRRWNGENKIVYVAASIGLFVLLLEK